jgi:hypothetical protein
MHDQEPEPHPRRPLQLNTGVRRLAAAPEVSGETMAYLRSALGVSPGVGEASAPLYVVCSAFSLEKGFARTSHWECEIWDLGPGAVVYSGVGETTNAGMGAVATDRGSLRAAFKALPASR